MVIRNTMNIQGQFLFKLTLGCKSIIPAARLRMAMRSLWLPLLLGGLAALPAGAQFAITKVEPPNWWVGMQWSRVQLMVYGRDLDGATAAFSDPRLRVAGVHSLAGKSYLFVDVDIPADLPAGDYTLSLWRNGEERKVVFPIRAREAAAESHRGFSQEDVVYLIAPDRFANGNTANDNLSGYGDFNPAEPGARHGGDLEGVIQRLDYLRDLGITAIWLMPVLENNGPYSYHGYAATDLYRIDPRLGSNEDYRRLATEAHKRGIKVIYDHVANHIGINHPWMSDLPAPDWINGSVKAHLRDKHFLSAVLDPHAHPSQAEEMRTFWFVDGMPDLNQRNPFMANYLIQNMIWWMEYAGLDGIREDTYPYPDQAFMARWARALLEEYPNTNIVGEIWVNSPAYLSQFQIESRLPRNFETNLPAVMDFPLCEAYRNYLRGEGPLRGIYDVLAQDFLYTDPANLLVFMDNHDMSRGAFLAGGRTDRMKQVLALALTTRGIPQLLYGAEINMMGGESHVELRADFPGGFPGAKRDAFTEAGRTREENEIFSFVRQLTQLRKAHPALASGRLIHQPPSWNYDVYAYWKVLGNEAVLVVVNGHDEEKLAQLPKWDALPAGELRWQDLLTGKPFSTGAGEGIPVPGRGVRILKLGQ